MLAVTGTKRSSFFPDTPTLDRARHQGRRAGQLVRHLRAGGTPPEVVARIGSEVAKAIALPEVKQRFAELGGEPVALDSAAFRSTIVNEAKMLSALIKDRKIAVD